MESISVPGLPELKSAELELIVPELESKLSGLESKIPELEWNRFLRQGSQN